MENATADPPYAEATEPPSAARPTVDTNISSQNVASPVGEISSADATTPEALAYYSQHVYPRQRPPAVPSPTSNPSSHSFERPALRSVSNPPLTTSRSASSMKSAPDPNRKTSARDLIAKYNQNVPPGEKSNQNRKTSDPPKPYERPKTPPMPSQPPTSQPSVPETPQTPDPGLKAVNSPESPLSAEALAQAHSSDLSSKLMSRFSARSPTYAPLNSPTSQPLFGEIANRHQELMSPGYSISPRRRNGRRESDGLMSHAGHLSYHSRSRSDLSNSVDGKAPWWENEQYRAGLQPSSANQKNRSDHDGSSSENAEPQDPNTPSKASLPIPRSRIPHTIPPRGTSTAAAGLAEPEHSESSRRPVTPPILLSSKRYDPNVAKSPSSGQKVKAIVTSPASKMSPPLRSSRPRQSVADYTSSYSAQMQDFYAMGSPENSATSPRRRRKLPDVSNMDITTRRESIRNAIKRSNSQQLSLEQIAKLDAKAEPAPSILSENSEKTIKPSDTSSGPAASQPNGTHAVTSETPKGEKPFEDEYVVSEPPRMKKERPTSASMPGSFPDTSGPEDNSSTDALPKAKDGPSSFQSEQQGQPEKRNRTVLSQIMEVRNRNPRELAQFGLSEGRSPDGEDGGTIQIMLGDSLMLEKGADGSQTLVSKSTAKKDDKEVKDVGAGSQRPPVETKESSASLQSSNLSVRGQRGSYSLDSDAYSLINKIVDQYRTSGTITDEMVAEFQEHIIDNDPELSKDDPPGSKEMVARIALEDLIRDRSNDTPTPVSEHRASYVSTDTGRSVGSKEGENYLGLYDAGSNTKTENNHLKPEVSITEPHPINRDRLSPSLNKSRTPSPRQKDGKLAVSDQHLGAELSRATTTASTFSDSSVSPGVNVATLSELELAYGADAARASIVKPSGSKLANFFGIDESKLPTSPGSDPPPTDSNSKLANFFGIAESKIPGDPAEAARPPAEASSITTTSTGKTISGPYFIPPPSTDPSSPISNSVMPKIMSAGVDGNRPLSYLSSEKESRSGSFDRGSQRQSQIYNDPSSEERRLTKRKNLVKELVDTEYSYNQDMKVVEDIYMGTANAVEQMSADDRKILFGNTTEIVKFSEMFLDALKQAVASVYVMPRSNRWQRVKRASFSTSTSAQTDQSTNDPNQNQNQDESDRKSSIGAAFCKHITQMEKVYGDYLKNHDSANQRLAKLQGIHQVSVWLNECHTYASDITSAWDLDSLLVKPVQRILKYPLLLKSLIEATPEDHPDYSALDLAAKEMMNVSQRINESKKRAELLEQVVTRKTKDFDVTLGLSKAFGRRTEKLRQQVGLTDAVDDPEYKSISAKYGGTFFQLQVVMRDFQNYKRNVESFMNQYNGLIDGFEGFIDVGMSTSPELESKWRKFANTIREIIAIAYVDHEAAVRKSCIDPLITLIRMNEGPQKLIQKRKKRLIDYAKYKSMKDRGDKPDKKTTEQGEQFIALNDTLKEELPKLFALTKKLVNATLKNFVDLQAHWNLTWQRKIQTVVEESEIPKNFPEIADAFKVDFSYPEASVLALGICNGSLLAESANFLSSTSSITSTDRTPNLNDSRRGTGQSLYSGQESPVYIPYQDSRLSSEMLQGPRHRSNSSLSIGQRPTLQPPNGQNGNGHHGRSGPPTSTPQRLSADAAHQRPTSSSTAYYSVSGGGPFPNGSPHSSSHGLLQGSHSANNTPPTQSSGVFSSAMPMDHSRSNSNTGEESRTSSEQPAYRVLFLAASLFEFNIDRARKEAGYPYLTYVPGEVFDVIGEKGELWLAKNQDDPTNTLGWIWEKHFAKLMQDDL